MELFNKLVWSLIAFKAYHEVLLIALLSVYFVIVHCYRPVVEAGTSSLKYLMVEVYKNTRDKSK